MTDNININANVHKISQVMYMNLRSQFILTNDDIMDHIGPVYVA